MKLSRKNGTMGILMLFAVLLLTVIGTRSIFAGTSSTAVLLEFPSGFDDPQGVELLPAGNNHYLLCGTQDNRSFVLLLDENGQRLDEQILSAHMQFPLYQDGKLALVCPYRSSNQEEFGVSVYTYVVRPDELDTNQSIDLPQIYVEGKNDFAMDSKGRFYAIHTPMEDSILLFEPSGWLLNQIASTRGPVTSVAVSPNNVLYTQYNGESKFGIKTMPDSIREETPLEEPPLFDSDIPQDGYRFLNKNMVMDESGNLYRVQSDTGLLYRYAETGGALECAAALSSNKVLVKTEDSRLLEYVDSENTRAYQIPGDLISISANGERAAAIVQREEDWIFLPITQELLEDESSSSQEESSEEVSSKSEESSKNEESSRPDNSSELPEKAEIISLNQSVRIDRSAQKIYLPANTTYAALKNVIRVQEGTLEAQKPNGVSFVSGYVMTGAVLIAQNEEGEISDSLTVVVQGDLSGTGRLTQTDSKLLYRVLSGTAELEEASFAAADMDGDGKITTADLLILKKELKKSS